MGRNLQIVFGLLSVACKSDVAFESKPSMSNMCIGQPGHGVHDALPVKMPKTCTECGPITDLDVLVRGVRSGSTYTLVDKDALAEAKATYGGQYKGTLSVVPHRTAEFLTATAAGDSLHYLTPADATAAGHYQLLVALLTEHPELTFAGLYTPVSATDLYCLTLRDGVLCLAKRTREQALKPAPSVGGEVNPALYAMLDGALESFIEPYDPDTYEDTYVSALNAMIENGETIAPNAEEVVVFHSDEDLMAKIAALGDKTRKAKAS